MSTEKQFILMNAYDGELRIGNWDPDWPEFFEMEEFTGQDLRTFDVDAALSRFWPGYMNQSEQTDEERNPENLTTGDTPPPWEME